MKGDSKKIRVVSFSKRHRLERLWRSIPLAGLISIALSRCVLAQPQQNPFPLIPSSAAPAVQITPKSLDKPSENEDFGADKDHKSDNAAEINVKNAEIGAILRIFSRKTGRNYILDERVKGKVTMYLPGSIPPEQSLKILDSVLALKGFTSVPIGENLWKVVPAKEAKQSTVPTLKDGDNSISESSGAVVTKLINFKYVSAEEIQPLVSQLISPEGFVSSYPGTNSMVVIDFEDNLSRVVDIISSLDIPFRNRDMVIIPVKHADASDIADKLKDLLGEDKSSEDSNGSRRSIIANAILGASIRPTNGSSVPIVPPPGGAVPPPSNNNGGNNQNFQKTKEPKIIADERTNSIIVVGDDDSIARIKALTSQLDTEVDLSGFRFYVYRCQHANAEELAQVLGGLAGEGSSTTGGSRGNGSFGSKGRSGGFGSDDESSFGGGGLSSRGGLSGRDSRSSRSSSRLSGTQRTPGRSRNEGRQDSAPASVQLGENLSITADPATNSLIIHASKADYEKIKSLIESLDIKRRQVLVEATLLEVSVNSNEVLGTDFLTSGGGEDGGVLASSNFNGTSGLSGIISDPSKLSNFTLAAASAGSLKIGGITLPTQAIVLNAAKSNQNANVLSAPTLLATDNEEAEIVVGQNVPFLASQGTSETNLNNTFNQIDRQDVGITLRITPQISSQDYVTLKIFTEVSSVVSTADTTLGPTTNIRTSETTVITKNGQMIVIGGLISDENNDSDNGVPFLKDVPVIGNIFRRTEQGKSRRNLLTFITPKIIKDQFDNRDVALVKRDSFKDEVSRSGVAPDRSEILDSAQIDQVTEIEPGEHPQPGTIRPSKAADKDASKEKLGSPQSSTSQDQGTPRKTISLKVSPKLPVDKKEANSAGPATAAISGVTHFVMKVTGGAENVKAAPFQATSDKYIGIVIPEGAPANASSFFALGSGYSYSIGDKTIQLTPVERYVGGSLISGIHGIKDNQWYVLSPHEMMSIGNGPWTRKG